MAEHAGARRRSVGVGVVVASFRRWLLVQSHAELLRDAARRISAVGGGMRAHINQGAGAEILQLREYRAGDPQNAIDWKATARRGRLISRDYTEDQHLDIVIAIDAGRTSALRAGDLDRLGHYINLAARFAEHAVAQDDRVGVMLFADQPLATLAPGRGIGSVFAFVRCWRRRRRSWPNRIP